MLTFVLANLYLHYSQDPEADYENAVKYADFMKKTGATYMNLQAVMWKEPPNDRPLDEQAILKYAQLSNKVGQLCKENGLVACFHPHFFYPLLKLGTTQPSRQFDWPYRNW